MGLVIGLLILLVMLLIGAVIWLSYALEQVSGQVAQLANLVVSSSPDALQAREQARQVDEIHKEVVRDPRTRSY